MRKYNVRNTLYKCINCKNPFDIIFSIKNQCIFVLISNRPFQLPNTHLTIYFDGASYSKESRFTPVRGDFFAAKNDAEKTVILLTEGKEQQAVEFNKKYEKTVKIVNFLKYLIKELKRVNNCRRLFSIQIFCPIYDWTTQHRSNL